VKRKVRREKGPQCDYWSCQGFSKTLPDKKKKVVRAPGKHRTSPSGDLPSHDLPSGKKRRDHKNRTGNTATEGGEATGSPTPLPYKKKRKKNSWAPFYLGRKKRIFRRGIRKKRVRAKGRGLPRNRRRGTVSGFPCGTEFSKMGPLSVYF